MTAGPCHLLHGMGGIAAAAEKKAGAACAGLPTLGFASVGHLVLGTAPDCMFESRVVSSPLFARQTSSRAFLHARSNTSKSLGVEVKRNAQPEQL